MLKLCMKAQEIEYIQADFLPEDVSHISEKFNLKNCLET